MNYQTRTFPSRVADLGFKAQLPADWISHELPAEELDVQDPTKMFPLAIVTAPHAAIVFSFAARPAYDDGTVHDWAWYHLNHNQLQPRAVGKAVVSGVPAVMGEAMQNSELGPMLVRFAFLEDGGRLINVSLMAPEMLAGSVQDAWFRMISSFTLESPKGSRFEIDPNADNVAGFAKPDTKTEETAPVIEAAQPEPAKQTEETKSEEENAKKSEGASDVREFHEFALAEDPSSFNPDQDMNARLRDRGAGLVPRMVHCDGEEKTVTLAAGAIEAFFKVPFGWHAMDDGKRVLVFEPKGEVQIHMHLLPLQGRTIGGVMDEIEQEAQSSYPAPEFVRATFGEIEVIGVRNIADGDQPLHQYHFLKPCHRQDYVLRARVTTTPERVVESGDLTELILQSLRFGGRPPEKEEPKEKKLSSKERRKQAEAAEVAAAEERASQSRAAERLEQAGDLAAAEQAIKDSCPNIGYAYATAEMYRSRMHRMKSAGDKKGAEEAFRQAEKWINFYASMATSGGEGEALSRERDAFYEGMVGQLGYTPQ